MATIHSFMNKRLALYVCHLVVKFKLTANNLHYSLGGNVESFKKLDAYLHALKFSSVFFIKDKKWNCLEIFNFCLVQQSIEFNLAFFMHHARHSQVSVKAISPLAIFSRSKTENSNSREWVKLCDFSTLTQFAYRIACSLLLPTRLFEYLLLSLFSLESSEEGFRWHFIYENFSFAFFFARFYANTRLSLTFSLLSQVLFLLIMQ